MKNKLISLSFLALALSSPVSAEDKYDYIQTPEPDQIADLQDDDSDGVINARDKCNSTPSGSDVDNYGCEALIEDQEYLKLKILFTNDSSVISPAFIGEIKKMVLFLERYPETSIEVQGYASKVGTAEYNLNLSKERANEVRDAIIQLGIDPSRVTITGYGDTVLDRDGESQVDHALNRRVTASVVGYDASILKEWTIFTKRPK
ncbi:OmpA family protein [Vibrio hannami]|uniref:OmpA family protein n=1 Tax=Vibrio hannami TaxID=2717094 RepID=UPI00240FA324|nr:OmpA family protein [Vibrio hannami]MDG3088068.1 OmpA family protein [Vibrio hannami]